MPIFDSLATVFAERHENGLIHRSGQIQPSTALVLWVVHMKFTLLAKLHDQGNRPTLVVPAGRERLYMVIFNGADFIFA